MLTLDVIGTFVFALSGASAAIRAKLDLFGLLVLSFVAATFGGVTRDLLIGAVPPAAIREGWYLTVAMAAGVTMFFWHPAVNRLRGAVQWFDAAGLSLCAVAGTQKALAYGIGPVQAALLGMVTGIGGGVVRDLLVREIPAVFRGELYAVAALSGSIVVVAGHLVPFDPTAATLSGAVLCFIIRMLAIRQGWNLPSAS